MEIEEVRTSDLPLAVEHSERHEVRSLQKRHFAPGTRRFTSSNQVRMTLMASSWPGLGSRAR
jgi:hypothetical protein